MIMKKPRWFLVISLFMFIFVVSIAYGQEQYWQLTFMYNTQSLTLIDAVKIPSMQKKIRTPGLTNAPWKLGYTLTWLDNKGN